MKAKQYPLFEPTQVPDYRLDGFVLTSETQSVLSTLQSWVASSELMLVICGSIASGKTHLAHILAHQVVDRTLVRLLPSWPTDSSIISNPKESFLKPCVDLPSTVSLSPDRAPPMLIIDNIGADTTDPRALLDLIENCRTQNCRLVLVGRGNPGEWAGELKDLYTRIEAMARITMPEPDESLIRKVIVRQLRARQLAIAPDMIEWIAERAAQHIPRTFAATELFTRALDLEALGEGRKPSREIVKRVLDTYFP